MSYIGQAAVIMRLKGFSNAKTIHSWIYNLESENVIDKETNNQMYDKYFGIPETSLRFKPKPIGDMDLIVIDEGGTVPMRMKKDIEKDGIPIIVAGDINQLPPVRDTPAYLYDQSKVMFLTENMRQQAGSNIPYLADRAINNLPIHRGFYGDAMVIYDDEVDNDMIAGADIILCGTNKTRDRLNKLVREEILGYTSDLPQYYEKLICRRSNWNREVNGIALANGLIGRTVSPIDVTSYNGTTFMVDFMPDLFDGIFNNVDINYEYFKAPSSDKLEIREKLGKFGIPGHCFDWGYCITTHLSQGAEYPNVIYFEEFTSPTIQNKLNFTAITRASQKLIYVKKKRQFFF